MENLFEHCRTNTDQGNIGLGYAVAYFLSKGYTVLNPITENQPYDLVVEKENKLFKVQVKTCSRKAGINKDKWSVALASMSYSTRKHFNASLIDYLFVLLSNGSMYLFDSKDLIYKKSSISLDPKKHYKNRIFLFKESMSFIKQKEIDLKYEKLKQDYEILLKDIRGNRVLSDNKKNYFESRRKVERPSYDQLKNDLEEMPYVQVGKKYGVSDNAIRKWIKYYEKYGEQ